MWWWYELHFVTLSLVPSVSLRIWESPARISAHGCFTGSFPDEWQYFPELWDWEVEIKSVCSAELPGWCLLQLQALDQKPSFQQSWPQGCHLPFCVFCFFSGKDHVCRFIGCGRNEKFNYVVMQLQVSSGLPLSPHPMEMASQWRIHSDSRQPSTGVETLLYRESGWNGRQQDWGGVLLWYPPLG